MLCYFGRGQRDYARTPLRLYRRAYWEFQAVISGQIAMTLETGSDTMKSRHLWLSSPRHAHGWIGMTNQVAEVAVFHFLTIPEPLARQIPAQGLLQIQLPEEQCTQLRNMTRQTERFWRRPGPEMLLRHEHLLMELSLLVFESLSGQVSTTTGTSHTRVQKALDYFADHMHRSPGLEEIAIKTSISVAQLRRLFHTVMHASPKKVFDQLRFQRAMQLMADPSTKLSTVSDICGFESPSAFSRAFKNKFGCSPQKWRG